MSTSTTKVEYMIISYTAKKNVQIKKFINELTLETIRLSLKSNNKPNFNLNKNYKNQHQTKYIDIQYHYVYELVNNKKLEIK